MKCAVLGSPIAHSLSPAMHRAAYAELGLDWTYDAVEVQEGTLSTFVGALGDDVRGLSVTAPLKREAARVAHHRSKDVEMLGVANTLVVDEGVLSADNTDVTGAIAALEARDLLELRSARIVGAGATATSMAYVLATVGVGRLELLVREPARAQEALDIAGSRGADVTIRRIDEPLIDKVDLLISTVPGEVVGSRSHELVDSSRAVFDVVYDPWPTPLATAAADAKVPMVSGLDLLAHQAVFQIQLMTGEMVSPQLLRRAALAELSTR